MTTTEELTYQILQIDPIAKCNLSCPLCDGHLARSKRSNKHMEIQAYLNILDEGKILGFREVHLFNWGESLLHPNIASMISAAVQRGFFTLIHSNLNVPTTIVTEVINSGLDHLNVSLDGITPITYCYYRKSGNFEQAMANLELAASHHVRGKLKVTWQFLVHSRNYDELSIARSLSWNMGIPFRSKPLGLGDDIPDRHNSINFAERRAIWHGDLDIQQSNQIDTCPYLGNSVTIHPNLGVGPCCMYLHPENDFGSVSQNSLSQVLTNDKFQLSRNLYNRKKHQRTKGKDSDYIVCESCSLRTISLPGPILPIRNRNPPLEDISYLVRDVNLANLLVTQRDSGIIMRSNIANHGLSVFRDKGDEIITSKTVNETPNLVILDRLNQYLINSPPIQIETFPSWVVMILGSGSYNPMKKDADVEFMGYAFERDPVITDILLPFLLGMTIGTGLNVDSWCAANILCGQSLFSANDMNLNWCLDAPLLRRFAKDNTSYTLTLIGEPLLCDLLGRTASGNIELSRSIRRQKLELLRRHEQFVLEVALEVDRHNEMLSDKEQVKARCFSALYLSTAVNLFEKKMEQILVDSVNNPTVLMNECCYIAKQPKILQQLRNKAQTRLTMIYNPQKEKYRRDLFL